jgi:hypothetical protein
MHTSTCCLLVFVRFCSFANTTCYTSYFVYSDKSAFLSHSAKVEGLCARYFSGHCVSTPRKSIIVQVGKAQSTGSSTCLNTEIRTSGLSKRFVHVDTEIFNDMRRRAFRECLGKFIVWDVIDDFDGRASC